MHTTVVVLFGRPGAGKLTVGGELATLTGYRLLHNHLVVDLATALFAFGSPPFVALRERLWLEAVGAAVDARVPGVVFTFAPERTVTDDFLARLEARVTASGGRVRYVELRCAPDELERRLAAPSRRGTGKLHDVSLYRRLDADGVFAHPRMPDAELVVATDALAPADAARRIAAVLAAAP